MSHRSAAHLWNLLPTRTGLADVIVSGTGGRAKRYGIRVHRSLTLVSTDVTLRHGIPVTTPKRTISDLRLATEGRAGALPAHQLRRAIRQAGVLNLPIGDEGDPDRARSDLESDFLKLCRRYALPLPEVNVHVGGHRVDFFWQESRLVVETDSYLYHRGRVAFQDDRGRDLELTGLGYEVLRLSERQVNDESDRVVETLTAALRNRRRG